MKRRSLSRLSRFVLYVMLDDVFFSYMSFYALHIGWELFLVSTESFRSEKFLLEQENWSLLPKDWFLSRLPCLKHNLVLFAFQLCWALSKLSLSFYNIKYYLLSITITKFALNMLCYRYMPNVSRLSRPVCHNFGESQFQITGWKPSDLYFYLYFMHQWMNTCTCC